jgi:hypothetical protein
MIANGFAIVLCRLQRVSRAKMEALQAFVLEMVDVSALQDCSNRKWKKQLNSASEDSNVDRRANVWELANM